LSGIQRFATNFSYLSSFCQKALSVENEDYASGYDISHVLTLSERIPVRACVDMHHYEAYHLGQKVLEYDDDLVQAAIQTWQGTRPLFHASQPIRQSNKLAPHSDLFWDDVRNHRYAQFLRYVDLDIEAKSKETAVKSFYDWIAAS
jgi:UV DNA damage repair endonuclease